MKRLFSGLLIATGAVVLAVGVLAAAEILLSNPRRQRARQRTSEPEPPAVPVTQTPKQRNFSIKRTKSEVGFVYWILEGFGRYKCYILCDSWDEAVEQAKLKLAEVDAGLVAV